MAHNAVPLRARLRRIGSRDPAVKRGDDAPAAILETEVPRGALGEAVAAASVAVEATLRYPKPPRGGVRLSHKRRLHHIANGGCGGPPIRLGAPWAEERPRRRRRYRGHIGQAQELPGGRVSRHENHVVASAALMQGVDHYLADECTQSGRKRLSSGGSRRRRAA